VLGLALHAAVFHPDGVAPAVLGAGLVPWIAGSTVRSRRLLARELGEKAARMAHAREQETRAARTAERVRVARELHDAVAHSISVIAIQAGGAAGLVPRDRARAAQTAALIATVGGDALSELGRLVAPADAGAASQPGLAGVDALARRARAGGVRVEVRVEGEPAGLPAGVDLAAYRIVQEALANVAKHAGAARAWVLVRYDRRAVELEVTDDGRGPGGSRAPRNGGGHGLVGIRERVALYDGTLDVGRRPGGGFLVHARLPLGGP
jgi:signal transduction histidine kinase